MFVYFYKFYRYKLVQSKQKNPSIILPYDLNPQTGQLRLKTSLDFENKHIQKNWDLTIIASIENKNPISVENNIRFELVDSNDNCPDFYNLPENFRVYLKTRIPKTPTESIIFTPKVRDADQGENAQIIFKLIGVEGSENYFDINFTNGQVIYYYFYLLLKYFKIKIHDQLPELETKWIVKVLAMDLGWPISHYTQIILTIQIGEDSANTSTNSLINFPNLINTCNLPNKHYPQIKNLNEEIFYVNEDFKPGMVKFIKFTK